MKKSSISLIFKKIPIKTTAVRKKGGCQILERSELLVQIVRESKHLYTAGQNIN